MKQYKAEDHTFVICAYKESPYLEDCIRSVLHQNVRGKICLTTSTPNQYIAALAQKYQIPVFANPVSEGIAADWNFAVASAKTTLVTLAHQDDLYEPSYTEKIIQTVNICQDPIILFSDYWELRGDQKSQSSSVMRGEASDAFALASPSLLEESVCTKTNPFDGKCDLLSGSDTRKECGAASGISEQYEEQYRLAGMGIAL